MNKLSASAKVYLTIVFIVLYAPILYLIFYSFNSGGSMNNFESFTLEHYHWCKLFNLIYNGGH